MNKKVKACLAVTLVALLLTGVAFPAIAEEPCDAVCRVEARIAEIRAERAIRYAEIRAASDARIAAILDRIDAERATWCVDHVAAPIPVPVVVPSYTAPVILSPGPNDVYGTRTRKWIDVRSRVPDKWTGALDADDRPVMEYSWWTESIIVPSRGEIFRWTWDGTLLADEYFQVQLICPNGSHRGIHPPTKELFTVQGGCLRYIVQNCKGAQTRAWDHESWMPVRNIPIEWTVVVIKWDGADPGKIGAMLAEAEARWMRI